MHVSQGKILLPNRHECERENDMKGISWGAIWNFQDTTWVKRDVHFSLSLLHSAQLNTVVLAFAGFLALAPVPPPEGKGLEPLRGGWTPARADLFGKTVGRRGSESKLLGGFVSSLFITVEGGPSISSRSWSWFPRPTTIVLGMWERGFSCPF